MISTTQTPLSFLLALRLLLPHYLCVISGRIPGEEGPQQLSRAASLSYPYTIGVELSDPIFHETCPSNALQAIPLQQTLRFPPFREALALSHSFPLLPATQQCQRAVAEYLRTRAPRELCHFFQWVPRVTFHYLHGLENQSSVALPMDSARMVCSK